MSTWPPSNPSPSVKTNGKCLRVHYDSEAQNHLAPERMAETLRMGKPWRGKI